jgi:hypothetical protein
VAALPASLKTLDGTVFRGVEISETLDARRADRTPNFEIG